MEAPVSGRLLSLVQGQDCAKPAVVRKTNYCAQLSVLQKAVQVNKNLWHFATRVLHRQPAGSTIASASISTA